MILKPIEQEYPYIGPGEKFNQYEYIYKRMKTAMTTSSISRFPNTDETTFLDTIQSEWNQTCIKYFTWKKLIDDSMPTLKSATKLSKELKDMFKARPTTITTTLNETHIKDLCNLKRKCDLQEEFQDRMKYMRL